MIFRTELIKNRKYKDLAKRINEYVAMDKTQPIFLYGHQYEWAKTELNAAESEPGIFIHQGIQFKKQLRGLK